MIKVNYGDNHTPCPTCNYKKNYYRRAGLLGKILKCNFKHYSVGHIILELKLQSFEVISEGHKLNFCFLKYFTYRHILMPLYFFSKNVPCPMY